MLQSIKKIKSKKLDNYYLGFSYSNSEIINEINNFNLNYIKAKNLTSLVAKELHNGKIVGIFNGKSEFGPRRLGE